jgi:hypothetical protein
MSDLIAGDMLRFSLSYDLLFPYPPSLLVGNIVTNSYKRIVRIFLFNFRNLFKQLLTSYWSEFWKEGGISSAQNGTDISLIGNQQVESFPDLPYQDRQVSEVILVVVVTKRRWMVKVTRNCNGPIIWTQKSIS